MSSPPIDERSARPTELGAAQLQGTRILLVDDESDVREMFAEYLRSFGVDVVEAGSADDAIAAFRARDVRIIVSDIAMPGRDGLSMIASIRAMSGVEGAHTPAIAISGHPFEAEAIRAGFDAFIRKPIDPRDLALRIQEFLTAA